MRLPGWCKRVKGGEALSGGGSEGGRIRSQKTTDGQGGAKALSFGWVGRLTVSSLNEVNADAEDRRDAP